jgi:hypothetical protein
MSLMEQSRNCSYNLQQRVDVSLADYGKFPVLLKHRVMNPHTVGAEVHRSTTSSCGPSYDHGRDRELYILKSLAGSVHTGKNTSIALKLFLAPCQ